MSDINILVTGFNKFANLEFNPSQILIEKLEKEKRLFHEFKLFTEILPTEFAKSGERIEELINEIRPRIIILIGVSQSRDVLSLERFAINIDDAAIPDNIGRKPLGVKIKKDGNEAYSTCLPLKIIVKKIRKLGLKAEISNHAGTFVCNHIYYITNYLINKNNYQISCGFLHIPLIDINKKDNNNDLNMDKLVLAVKTLLVSIYNNINEK
jgi:pyroglutamyl-peptidase